MKKTTGELLELIKDKNRNLGFEEWVINDFRLELEKEGADGITVESEYANVFANKVIDNTKHDLIEIASSLEDYTQRIINQDIADYNSYSYSINGVIFDGIYEYLWDLFSSLFDELELNY